MTSWGYKANLRDLIAATRLVILQFVGPCDLTNRRPVWSWNLMKFGGSPRHKIGHLFLTTSSFVHHFKTISEFKLEFQSGNAQFESKLAIICPGWPWNLTDGLEKQKGTSSTLRQALGIISNPLVNSNWSYCPEVLNWCQNIFFSSRMTSKFNGWP